MGEKVLKIQDLKAQDIEAVIEQYQSGATSFFFYKNLLPALFCREQLVFALASPRTIIKSILDNKKTLLVMEIDQIGNKAIVNILVCNDQYEEELKEKTGDLLLELLKEKPEIQKITVMLLPEEITANKILKELKFKQEGKFKQHIYIDGKYRDLVCWAVFREEFL